LADHLGMNRFAVIGVSGGGPHSAVCARLLPDRVSAAGIISGLGPLSTPGAEQHMKPANRAMFRLARTLPTLLYALSYVQVGAGRRWPERTFRVLERQFPMPDIEVLRRPEVRETMFIDDLRQAPPTAARAAAQEFALFAADWGFRLENIAVPVHLWHGDLDRNVPISHGRAQAERIPGATFHECPGEAHLLIVDHFEEILHTVTESA
jgi:pimeloyl-ACP methyl ester carboxylesterase